MSTDSTNKKDKITWSDSEDSWDEFEKAKERKCTYCTKTLLTAQDVPLHEEQCRIAKSCLASKVTCKDGSQKFICDICCSTYKYLFKLAEHEKRHEPPGGFICRYCDAKFCTEVQLEQHTEEAHKVYKCQICKETFETGDSYIVHIQKLHNGHDKEYKACEECGRHFKSPLILKFHMETNCGKNKRYKCDECGKTFQTNGTLKTHKLIHSGEKRFCCSFCGMKFIVKGLLTRHERTHTGEKPYVCNICFKSFSHRDSIITHSTTHTGMKPYICECCGSRFSCTSNIIQHRRKRPETCGQPQYCTKLSKACQRPGVNNPEFLTSHEPVRLFKAHKVIKTTEKEKLKLKMKAAREEKKMGIKSNRKRRKKISKGNEEIGIKKSQTKCNDGQIKLKKNDNVNEKNFKKTKTVDKSVFQQRRSPRIKSENKIEEIILPSINEEGEPEEENTDIITKIVEIADIIKVENEQLQNSNLFQQSWNFGPESIDKNVQNNDIKNESTENNLDNLTKDEETKLSSHNECSDTNISTGSSSNSNSDESDYNFTPKSKTENNRVTKKVNRKLVSEKTNDEENTIQSDNEYKKSSKRLTFDCYECPDKVYSRKNSYHMHLLKFHYKTEDEIKHIFGMLNQTLSEYACHICGKFYSMPKALRSHLQRHGPDGSLIFKCKTCTKYFASKEELKSHYQIDHKDKITCNLCNKTYKDSGILASHKRKAHSTNQYKNDNEKELKIENVKPLGKTKYQPSKQTFVCNICGKILKSKCSLVLHERSDCGKNPIFKCNVCGKALTTAGILKSHMLIHSGELPHQCSYCEKRFRQRQQLTCHERTHTGEKPYPCTFCGKAFAFVENLYIHLSTHTGIKRFMCTTCGDRFSCISGLKNHWRTNSITCGADPNRSTKAVGEYMGFQKGQLVHKKKLDD